MVAEVATVREAGGWVSKLMDCRSVELVGGSLGAGEIEVEAGGEKGWMLSEGGEGGY
jgi:hypothetical protein